MEEKKRNDQTGYDIRDISIWYDAFGLTYRLGKGDYLIMGIDKGSSLILNKKDFVIYSTDTDFNNIVNSGIDAADLFLERNGNHRDSVRPHTVRCNSKETLRLLMSIYAQNPLNKSLDDSEECIKTNEIEVKSLRRADPQILFNKLKALRLLISREESIPAFCVFSDKVLFDLADIQPMTKSGMLEINGVGETKYIKYGERFLNVIRECCYKNENKNESIIRQKDDKAGNLIHDQNSVITSKPKAIIKKNDPQPLISEKNSKLEKKKREQYTLNGEIYYLIRGRWVNSHFTSVSKEEMYKLNSLRVKDLNFDNIEPSELIKMAQEMKDSEDYIYSKRLFETLFEKCDEKEVVRSILSRYTSILRNLEQPKEAIEIAEKYISKYGNYVYTPALFTSLAGAYCDLGDPVEARKKANIANAMSGGNAGIELQSVYARIKAMEY